MAKSRTKKKEMIADDPLAWLEDEDGQEGNELSAESASTDTNIASKIKTGDVQDLDLGDNLNIRDIEDLHQSLSSSLEDKKEVSLNASNVQKADAVSLQMLAAFYQSGPALGINIKWSGCSENFRQSSELLGLVETLGIDSIQ